jgi:hypothetical protein
VPCTPASWRNTPEGERLCNEPLAGAQERGHSVNSTLRGTLLRLLAIAAPGIAGAAYLFTGPALPQSLTYHRFADQRTLLGVPHCLNVVSNLPFLILGVLGLRFVLRSDVVRPDGPFLTGAERWPYAILFLAVGLTAFGSAYYHLDPTNDRLFWDRLPMALAFMALFDAVLGERLGVAVGRHLLLPLLAVGLASSLYWHWTEQQGRGDLRPYYLVQFYPGLAIPLLLLLFPPRYTHSHSLFVALGWYVLAKFLEHPFDHHIFRLGQVVSGHTLKHLAAACGVWVLLRMVRERRPISPSLPTPLPTMGKPA